MPCCNYINWGPALISPLNVTAVLLNKLEVGKMDLWLTQAGLFSSYYMIRAMIIAETYQNK